MSPLVAPLSLGLSHFPAGPGDELTASSGAKIKYFPFHVESGHILVVDGAGVHGMGGKWVPRLSWGTPPCPRVVGLTSCSGKRQGWGGPDTPGPDQCCLHPGSGTSRGAAPAAPQAHLGEGVGRTPFCAGLCTPPLHQGGGESYFPPPGWGSCWAPASQTSEGGCAGS